jgi:hypothetical protein
VTSPFKRINECVEAASRIDVSEMESKIVPFFIGMLKHQYGEHVYELSDLEVEDDFVVLVDTRAKWLLARICGASYELERTYKLELSPSRKPTYVTFTSWMPEHCGIHCHYDVDKHTLTLMPMTAAVLRFPEIVRMRVEPL